MPTLGPQIVSQSYGNLLKFLPTGEAGVTINQIQITDGKGKVTPLYLATGSVLVDNEFTASAEVVFSGLTSNAPGQYVSFDTSNGRLYYSATSSIQNVVSASYAVSAAFAPNDGDWTVGSSFMTASGQTSVYIPGKLEQGEQTQAIGLQSHAEGYYTIASGSYSHAEGGITRAIGATSHAEGGYTYAGGIISHAEGWFTTASGFGSHAEGQSTTASGSYSHAEGERTLAIGQGAHSEGQYTTASGDYSHAEGYYTIASGSYSHAEGSLNITYGQGSHVEGVFNEILTGADFSHVGGIFNKSQIWGQTVVGQDNDYANEHPDDTFVVGTGTGPSSRADGFKVRANTHEVAVMQQNSPNWPNSNIYKGPGLYFGEPEASSSTRIVSTQQVLPGYMFFQSHDGTQYNNMMQFNSNVIFILNP